MRGVRQLLKQSLLVLWAVGMGTGSLNVAGVDGARQGIAAPPFARISRLPERPSGSTANMSIANMSTARMSTLSIAPPPLPALAHPSVATTDGWDNSRGTAESPEKAARTWELQLLPQGRVYPAYLASTKESRFAAHIVHREHDGALFDGVLGTRVGLLRYGDRDAWLPEGFQIDAEGSGQVRLDFEESMDVRSVDFRAGVPITYGVGRQRWKFGYYHLSSHLGDEFLLKNPTFNRLNYSRDVLLLGHLYFWTDEIRSYAEAGWAFKEDVSSPWEFQFGIDRAPRYPTGRWGAPFWAVNAHLREEVEFGGGLTVQAGWAWRGGQSTNMLRLGIHYYNGESNQLSFFDEHEEQIGIGLWYDP